MYIDVVESLRCPNAHAESALVGVFASVDGRDVVDGVLGCPVCHAEFAIRDGVVWFAAAERSAGARAPEPADEEEAMRIAAFLNLTEPAGFAVLHGRWAAHAPIVNGFSPTHLVLLDPIGEIGRAPGITIIRGGPGVPLATNSAHAAAIDDPESANIVRANSDARQTVIALSAVVRPGGRIMAPVTMSLPPGTRELVHDARVWVAERIPLPQVIPLTRHRDQ